MSNIQLYSPKHSGMSKMLELIFLLVKKTTLNNTKQVMTKGFRLTANYIR
jgi:hypothetical protein